MTQASERDRDLDDPAEPQRPSLANTLLPLIVAAVLAIVVIAMVYRAPTTERAGDTNAGSSVQTVNPAPLPSTSPAVPTPSPTTEPRQAPQP